MARRPKPVPQMTVAQFDRMFPDEAACKSYLQARRWPNGVICPRCGSDQKIFAVKSMPFKWQCYDCTPNQGYRFSVIAGTIFENTNKPLRDWFRVTHLMLASKKGMSALQIQRMLGFGSYETAHSMCHKIRAALIEPEQKLGGIVEVDETWVGGKDANRHWHKKHHGQTGGQASGKTPFIGAVSRKGNVVARALSRVTKVALERFVREAVSNKVSLLATDENRLYDGLTEYKRGTVQHQKKQYVVGAIHTNAIEGFWSIFKRGVMGSFHKVSEKYMPLYVAEFQFRYNNRHNPDIFGAAVAGC
jgi:transposase-like protein